MSLLGTALSSIGGKIVGSVVGKAADWLYGSLPKGAQSFLGGVGDFLGIGSEDIGKAAASVADTAIKQASMSDVAPKGMLSVGSSMAAGKMTGAGAGAQMLPLGSSDRVSRALQDARVAQKLARMSGQAIPAPNLRGSQTISLASATPPRTALTKKFSG